MNLEDVKIGMRVRVSNGYVAPDKDKQRGRTGIVTKLLPKLDRNKPEIQLTDSHVSILFDDGGVGTHFYAQEFEPIVERNSQTPQQIPQSGKNILPDDPKDRKTIPIATGVLDYFPAALAEVAKVSYQGSAQHNPDNPGEPLHWARGKSSDQADAMIRHYLERGSFDTDGQRHSAKMCWRALAILQLELEEAGAPIARGAKE